jgi:RNA polymerase primary sigma factor
MPLVVHFVAKHNGKRGNFMDLIQEGNLGLIRAVEKYDPSHNTAFSTYAMNWLRAFVNLSAKRMNSPVHVPTNSLRAATLPASLPLDDLDYHETPCQLPISDARLEVKQFEHYARRELDGAAEYMQTEEKYILEHHLLADKDDKLSLAEIARRHGVSRELARQWSIRTKAKIHAYVRGARVNPNMSLDEALRARQTKMKLHGMPAVTRRMASAPAVAARKLDGQQLASKYGLVVQLKRKPASDLAKRYGLKIAA